MPASADDLAVSGESNRADGHWIVVELLRSDGSVARSVDAAVTNGTWRATLDLAGIDPGSYTLRVTDGDVASSVPVVVVAATPSETPFESPTPTPDDTQTAAPTVTPPPTTMPIPSPVPTLARSPGFGVGTAVVAVVLVFFIVGVGWRRRL